MAKNILEIKNLTFSFHTYGGVVKSVRDVSFNVREGEILGIVGESGCGKSVTSQCILKLNPEPPGFFEGGSIKYKGEEIITKTDREMRKIRGVEIGFIFQQFHLLPKLSALENVELPLIYQGMPTKKRREKAVKALKAVGLEKRMNHKPNQLSGGQQQRVAIARALVGEPSLILADEPTGNLDSRSGKEIMMLLHNLYEEGNTIVLITHDNNVAMEAPRQVQISDGKIIKDSGGEAEYEDHTSN
jgi:ABC-type lipoprotein export system ATPase subunit